MTFRRPHVIARHSMSTVRAGVLAVWRDGAMPFVVPKLGWGTSRDRDHRAASG
jgi:hypothetical protein